MRVSPTNVGVTGFSKFVPSTVRGVPRGLARRLPSYSARSLPALAPRPTASLRALFAVGPSLSSMSAGQPRCPNKPPRSSMGSHAAPPEPWLAHQDFVGHLGTL